MTTTDALLEAVRTADPIADIDAQQWSSSADAQRVLDSIVGSSIVVARRPSRRRRTLWIGATVVVAGAMATGVAASGMLGEPAPEPIRADLAAVDQGLPEDLRANPDVENAMAVASTAGGVLYAADVKDGGYCYELATNGDQPRGAVCVTASRLGDRAIDITAPIPSDDTAPLFVAGRINDDRVERIVARYPNGTTVDVELGLAGYWLFEVPDGARDVALTDGLEIVGVWHTHPDHPARPSPTDRAAAWHARVEGSRGEPAPDRRATTHALIGGQRRCNRRPHRWRGNARPPGRVAALE